MIGRLVSGRYRIEAVVGTGGMAVVYRALDTQKNMPVAIKVLRPEYESDMAFVHRFSIEAEAAAKMSHENIVNLLDVGIDNEMRYIVMEYVDGHTLKEMIRREKRIHPDVALRMTIRILAAVDHAHRNGIVHRDIKPQNILVDGEGVIKVADFGIARLKTDQTAQVNANGKAVGSVHYLSPEQARGEVADEQSDLYSVGVVMYEMLTGELPFDGDTPGSVARKHVSEAPESMRGKNPEISRALDEVVMRALCKNKARRYQSAAEMAADLRMTIEKPKGGFVRYPDPQSGAADGSEKKAEVPSDRAKETRKKHRVRRVSVVVVAIVTVLAVLGVGGFYMARQLAFRKIPQLIGMRQQQAEDELMQADLAPLIVNAYSEDFEDGTVMLQSREAGAYVEKGSPITLTVSLGSQWYELRDMTGWDSKDAIRALEDAHVREYTVQFVQSDLPAGRVVSMDVPAGRASRDKAVNLTVSGRRVSVPQLTGLTLDGAKAVLKAENLAVGEITEGKSADAEAGTVIGQSIAPYTQVLTDTAVDITICAVQTAQYAPMNALTIVVPLDNLRATVRVTTPSGMEIEAVNRRYPQGRQRVELVSPEAGLHTVSVYMDDILMEQLTLDFE